MKKKCVLAGIAVIYSMSVFADCSFVFVNKTPHDVTLTGFYIDNNSDVLESSNWVTAKANQTTTQLRGDIANCNSSYNHSGELITRIKLKNNTGSWIATKGFLFATDRSYASVASNTTVLSDDESAITLSNGMPITRDQFKVMICTDDVDSDECN